jgi:hypothetical protein
MPYTSFNRFGYSNNNNFLLILKPLKLKLILANA